MRKFLLILAALLSCVVIVSCATTAASDVEPVVREIDVNAFTTKTYTDEQIYQILERYVKDSFGTEKDLKVEYNKEQKAITVSGYELDSNVGPLAQDGYIIIDMKFEAKGGKAVFTILFVDSYYFMSIGPMKKKVSQGITELGLKELDYQAQYLADGLQSSIGTYTYYIDNGLI